MLAASLFVLCFFPVSVPVYVSPIRLLVVVLLLLSVVLFVVVLFVSVFFVLPSYVMHLALCCFVCLFALCVCVVVSLFRVVRVSCL